MVYLLRRGSVVNAFASLDFEYLETGTRCGYTASFAPYGLPIIYCRTRRMILRPALTVALIGWWHDCLF